MRLVTVRTSQRPRACAVGQGGYVDLQAGDPGLSRGVKAILGAGVEGLARAREAAARSSVVHDPETAVLLAPVPDPAKIISLGLNYRDHAEESGMAIPAEPILFSKYATTLIGHGATIELPDASHKLDYEAELVFVIGKSGR